MEELKAEAEGEDEEVNQQEGALYDRDLFAQEIGTENEDVDFD